MAPRGFAAALALLALSACATPPNHINNVCAVFDQNDGWFDNWQSAAERAMGPEWSSDQLSGTMPRMLTRP